MQGSQRNESKNGAIIKVIPDLRGKLSLKDGIIALHEYETRLTLSVTDAVLVHCTYRQVGKWMGVCGGP